jgi:hypothetical protein
MHYCTIQELYIHVYVNMIALDTPFLTMEKEDLDQDLF